MNTTTRSRASRALAALAVVAASVIVGAGPPAGADEPCVPAPAWTETVVVTPAVPGSPAVPEVPAVPAVEAQHYSWTGGPLELGVIPPAPPLGSWQANTTQEPHSSDNVTWFDGEGSGLHYTSHESAGKADWFYFQPYVPGTDAIPGTPAVDPVAAVTRTIEHPAVVCPVVPGQPVVPVVPEPEPEDSTPEPVKDDDPVVTTETHSGPDGTIKTETHESGKVTERVVIPPLTEEAVEEGL